jgi:acyl carrier protein
MEKEHVKAIVTSKVSDYLKVTKNIDLKLEDSTRLIGGDNYIESIDLVSIILDIEEAFRIQEKEISLTSEKAMSIKNSPFKTISSLVDFIYDQMNENHE